MTRHPLPYFLFSVLLLLALLAGACAAPAAEPTAVPGDPPAQAATGEEISGTHTFVIVPEASQASYIASEEFFDGALAKLGIEAGLADAIGRTNEIEGQIQLNFDDLSSALGDNHFTVNLATLVTGRDMRDEWIRENGPHFNRYPLAEFTATSISGAPASYRQGEEVSFDLSGDLTIREITQPVTFAVTASLLDDTLTGVATTRLLMSDFGIETLSFVNTLTVENEFGIEVTFTAREP